MFDDDIFKMLDRIFEKHSDSSERYIDFKLSERIIDDNHIYYTFQTYSIEKEDIFIEPKEDTLTIQISKENEPYIINLPYRIIPKEIKSSFKNGLLDITLTIDKSKDERIKVGE